MISTGLLRASLWLSFPFNLMAALIFAFPAALPGRLLGLAADTDPLYRALCAFLVALFGFAYAWLARQPDPRQPMLILGAAGKAGAFSVAMLLWMAGAGSPAVVLLAVGDLVLAAVWILAFFPEPGR